MNRPESAIHLLPAAEDDLLDILSYVGSENPGAAEALQEKITRGLLLLCRHTHMGRIPEEEELVRMGYRYLVIENYLVFYTIESDDVIVHRIVHGARDYRSML